MAIIKGKEIQLDKLELDILKAKAKDNPDIRSAINGINLKDWFSDLVNSRLIRHRILNMEFNGEVGVGKSMCALTVTYNFFKKVKARFELDEEFEVEKRIAQRTEDVSTLIDNLKKEYSEKYKDRYYIGSVMRDEVPKEYGEGSDTRRGMLSTILTTHREDGVMINVVEPKQTYIHSNDIILSFEAIGSSWGIKNVYDGKMKFYKKRAKEIAESKEGTMCIIKVNHGNGHWVVKREGYIVFESIDNPKIIEDYLKLKRDFIEKFGRYKEENITKVVNILLEDGALEKIVRVSFDDVGYGSIKTKKKLKRYIQKLSKTNREIPLLTNSDIENICEDYEIERVQRELDDG